MLPQKEIFHCPYCGSVNDVSIDYSAGKRQQFINDCVTCCKPILIKITLDTPDLISINVEQENG